MKEVAIIAVCDFDTKPVGGEVFLLNNLLKEKCKEELNIRLIGLTFDKKDTIGKWNKKNINNIEYEFLPVAYANTKIPLRFQLVYGIKKFKKEILKKNIECIYIHSAEIIIPFINDSNLDIVYHVHGNPLATLEISRFSFFRNDIFSRMYRYLVKKSMQMSKLIIWAADKNKDEFLNSNYHMKDILYEKSITIHSCFDTKLKCSNNEKIFDFNSNKKYLISVGRLNKGKQVDIIIKALKKLKNYDAELIICGDGEEKKSLIDLSKSLEISDKVHFMGNVNRSELAYLLSNSDVFVFASKSEALSLVVLESLYMGTPVVSSDIGDIPILVKDGISGKIIFSYDENSFSNGIMEILKHGKEYYTEKCKLIANEFSPQKMSESIYYNLKNY